MMITGISDTTVAPAAPAPTPSGVRLTRLLGGLALFGFSLALMVRADLGLGPLVHYTMPRLALGRLERAAQHG